MDASMQICKTLSAIALVASLLGCSGANPDNLRPWEEASKPSAPNVTRPERANAYGSKLRSGQPYVVVRGDTLYAIAFRLGIDFKELAARNNIGPPFTIKVGQTLSTDIAAVRPSEKSSSRLAKTPKSKKSPSKASKTTKPTVSAPKPSKVTTVIKKSSSASKPRSNVITQPVSRWRWPSEGKVIRTYSSNLHKGIDLSGDRGDPVRAVASGKVVYAGTGVTGYGSLLIIKHNDTYLSAYGHNERLLVSENTSVTAGQQIATMGSSGTDSVKLHFELRRRGKPVDPLTLLPMRR
ncbi:peptidoglycan DD-metalloendopeptidase family protein [Luminiphilus sp.]|nr:peptidoglycan DD-metalloendopeptidase family protein [Luminiphilus sp.]